MKDQHKNKLLEVSSNLWQMLGEQPSPCLQFKSALQNRKNKVRGEPRMGEKSGKEENEGEGRLVEVPLEELEQQLAVYAWRMRTNQPILAANCLELQLRRGDPFIPLTALRSQLIRSPLHAQSPVRLRVQTEPSSPLSDLMPPSLSQHLYCLKEAAYGFEQLHSCFGGFDVQSRAIRVAAGGRVKVWWGMPLMSNPRGQGEKGDQRRVVEGVIRVFQGWRGESKGFRQFYEEAKQAATFLQLLRTIDAFIQLHKIKIDKRIILKDQQMAIRPQSPRPDIGRVPKFLSPNAISTKPAAGVRLSLGVLPHAGRLPLSPPQLLPMQPSSPSPSPEKAESISLMATTQTHSPRRVNLVRTDKQRKGSDSNFCFTSLHRLEAARENLLQAKTSQICHSPQTMTSLDPGSSLLRNVEQLFEDGELQGLSVSVEMKSRSKEGKGLALYGRRVNESFINTHPQQ